MTWTAPRDWNNGEVETGPIFNTHIRDNLNYLKGNAGDIGLADDLIVGSSDAVGFGAGVNRFVRIDGSAIAGLSMQGNQTVDGDIGLIFGHNAALGGGDRRIFQWAISRDGANNSGKMRFITWNAGTPITALTIKPDGKVGIGVDPPQGLLHVAGAGGGMLFLSASAVAGSVVTMAAAGTVTGVAQIFGFSRNNGTGVTITNVGQQLALGGSVNNTGTDTLTIAVTAGGAITAQRTAGTQTHNVNLMVVFV